MATFNHSTPAPIQGTLFAPEIPHDFMASASIRTFRIGNDLMEPSYRLGDFVIVIPADKFRGEGVYILDRGAGPDIYRAHNANYTDVEVYREHPALRDKGAIVPMEQFDDCVLGFVVGSIAITHRGALRRALAA